jgi:hypothetical protein
MKGKEMDLNATISIPIKFHSMEHDVFMIRSLQQLYSDHFYERKNNAFNTEEDRIDCEERIKAAETLLKYYMFPKDYLKFFESVGKQTEYVFEVWKYTD